MSIVEKTLKKLQEAAQLQRSESGGASSPIGRAGSGGGSSSMDHGPTHVPPRRVQIGNPEKRVRVDNDRLRANSLLPPEHQQRELAHQYRTLKRPLIRNAFESGAPPAGSGSSLRLIMVSSALPGEGKTFTSLNLAMSLALEKDHSVILVDGDVPKPHITRTFGLMKEPGLLDALTDPGLAIESVVVPTDMPGLSILPVGHRAEAAPELLASARMRQVITRLEQLDPQGFVVVDSPPILLTSEARVLASLFGQVVLVVHAGTTQQKAVMEAIELIGEGPRVGLVLNQAVAEGHAGDYYGYYYGSSEEPVEQQADVTRPLGTLNPKTHDK